MTEDEFNNLASQTRMEGSALQAAKLYLVDQIRPQVECARQAKVSTAATSKAIKRIREEMKEEGQLSTLKITIPAALEKAALMYIKSIGGQAKKV